MRLRSAPAALAVALVAAVAVGCGGSESASTTKPQGPAKPVSIALSWSPNTDYTGIYVAEKRGLYRDAGIKLKVLPYASTLPETLVAAGKADLGFSYQAGLAYARAGGKDLVAIFAPHQKGTYAIGVSADRNDIKSPKDLDGKIYAGFGTPDELPLLKQVIRADGGKGDFRSVTLDTAAYQAVRAGKADFTIPVTTWEGVEAKSVGKPMKYFKPEDYGFPEQYSSLIVASGPWLEATPELAKAFVTATEQGYRWAAENPAKAAAMMIAANPGVFKNPSVVQQSQKLLADGGYTVGPDGEVGVQSGERWQKYGNFLFANGLLTGADGKPLKTEPNWSEYFTNAYLAKPRG
ncbi:MAG: ABC transporter substrate-binding protein [Actinomycetes bacterium]